jgi:hypothetical protein
MDIKQGLTESYNLQYHTYYSNILAKRIMHSKQREIEV